MADPAGEGQVPAGCWGAVGGPESRKLGAGRASAVQAAPLCLLSSLYNSTPVSKSPGIC